MAKRVGVGLRTARLDIIEDIFMDEEIALEGRPWGGIPGTIAN